MQPGTDVAITHGPPRGILDVETLETEDEKAEVMGSTSCGYLFDAVTKAVPRLHCFGNSHSNGVGRGQWSVNGAFMPGEVVSSVARIRQVQCYPQERPCAEKRRGTKRHARKPNTKAPVKHLSLGDEDTGRLGMDKGKETLFVNARGVPRAHGHS